MDAERRDQLHARHDYGEWHGRSALGRNLIAPGFAITGRELAGWALQRADRKPGLPAHTTSLWRRPKSPSEELIRLDVYELLTIEAAHDWVIELLGDFQATEIRRRTPPPVGDVAFGTPLVLLFARANLVILVRNAGRDVIEVATVARDLDAHLAGLLTRGEKP